MQLEHSFTVPVPVEVAWQALLDPQRVAPCFPGATLTGVDGSEFSGTVKVRMGPVSLLYKGTGRFTTADEAARRLVLEATGKDSRGNGTAHAMVTATLSPGAAAGAGAESGAAAGAGAVNGGSGAAGATTVGVVTDLTITGRPAQFGRGLIGEIGGKLLDTFAGCLATRLTESAATPAAATPAPPPPATESPPAPASPPAAAVASRADGPSARLDRANGPSARNEPAGAEPAGAELGVAGAGDGGTTIAQPARAAEEIDLLDLAGPPVLRRLLPVLGALLALVLVLRWLRRRG